MKPPRKRNPVARDLRTPKYRLRVVKPRKGTYRRQEAKREGLQEAR